MTYLKVGDRNIHFLPGQFRNLNSESLRFKVEGRSNNESSKSRRRYSKYGFNRARGSKRKGKSSKTSKSSYLPIIVLDGSNSDTRRKGSYFDDYKDYTDTDDYKEKSLFKKSPFWGLPMPSLDAIFSSSQPKERLSGSETFGGGYGGGCSGSQGLSNLIIFLSALAASVLLLNQAIIDNRRREIRTSRKQKKEAGFLATLLEMTGLDEFEDKIEELGKGENRDLVNKIKRMGQTSEDENQTLEQEEIKNISNTETTADEGGWFSMTNIVKEFFKIKDEVAEEMEEERIVEEEAEMKLSGNQTFNQDDSWLDTNSLKKRSLGEDDTCKIQIWRCLSGVMESGIQYLDKPGQLWGAANKYLFKMAFHGLRSGVWGSLMTIPEARKVARCVREHDDCREQEIYSHELQGDQDGMKRRVIVDTEFLKELDMSDGSTAYDYDEDDHKQDEKYYDALEDNQV